MTIDVKVIGVYLWRFSVLFAGICFRFAQKHPRVSGTFFSFLFLYVFFPLVFRLLIYSSPIIIWAYTYRKNITKPEHPEPRIQKKYDQTTDVKNVLDTATKRHVNFLSHRDGRIDVEEKDKELKKAQRELVIDAFGKAENDLKKIKELGKAENAEARDDNFDKHNGESESDILDKAEYEEDEETQEEDAQLDTRKAVEWTEQDERNLMDLGTSETERDKRLESLIQKRRARKLLSMQVRNVIDIIRHQPNQVAPLVIARSTGPLNLINTLSDTDDLHMPGSAPSVLLPSRSPFDLPYDPFEERPDLTGDSSFEQEFVTADQKDFCRHESFFYGGHSGTRQDGNSLNSFMNAEKKRTERQRFSRFRSYIDRGSYESLSPGTSSVEHELMNYGDMVVPQSERKQQSSKQPVKSDSVASKDNTESVNTNTERNEQCHSEPPYADRCEGPGTEGNLEPNSFHSGKNMSDNPAESAKADSDRNLSSEDLSSYLHKSLGESLQETVAKGAKENGRAQAPIYTSSKDLFNVHKRVLHTPAHSIASDLVVEVSEAGSPPPTLSPPDEDSSHYDGDVERDLSSGSEDLSMHVYRMEEHGTRSLEGQESIPEVVELEEEVVDEYDHTSPTSSDDNSSYENVVHHLTEKLNARRVNNKAIMGAEEEPRNHAEMGSGIQIESLLSNQTNPMSGATESGEGHECNSSTTDKHETTDLDIDSSKQENRIIEEDRLNLEEEGSSNMQVAEVVREGTEVSTSGNVTLPAERQAQANEDVTEVTSPNSVLPDTDFIDQITRVDSQRSDLADSVSDVNQLENSTSSMPDTEIQNARSLPSELNTQQGNNNEGHDNLTELESRLHPSIAGDNTKSSMIPKTDEEVRDEGVNQVITDQKYVAAADNADAYSEKLEETVLKTTEKLQADNLEPVGETSNSELTNDAHGTSIMNNQADLSEALSSAEALPLSNTLHSDDEFNGMSAEYHDPDLKGGSSTAESSKQNVDNDPINSGEQSSTSVKCTEPPSNRDTQTEAPLSDMDTELHIHRITETCM